MRNVAGREQQLSLIPEKKQIVSRPPSIEHVRTLKNHAKALEYACDLADVDPKELCGLLVDAGCRYDKTKWSRILSGERALPSADIPKLNAVLANKAYLMYVNHICGIDIATIRDRGDDKDRRIADLEQHTKDQDRIIDRMAERLADMLAQRAGK